MGVWRYCECGHGTAYPDAEEHIQGFQRCAACDAEVPVHEDERRRFFLEMHQRLERVENQVAALIKVSKLLAKQRKALP
ncbi:hypothetical protein EVB78_162 [Rhizobium phage RHph_N1_15]|nr:hypothetical protein EVB77_162 [Rhizobium phage RHph_N1_10]QIG69364.1 hypothetical protein EVB78_162 [Rhizobium phage RHph_N1_15]QIG75224.1 hypothetical protein EVC15_162 [Rhizobium phage RHph_N2_6]